MTVRVVGVEEGGLLRVEGKKLVNIDDISEELVLRGLVRPDDVTTRNMVESWRIGDVELVYTTEGTVARRRHHRTSARKDLAMSFIGIAQGAAPRNARRLSIISYLFALVVLTLLVLLLPGRAHAQEIRISDLTIQESSVPVRLMGYGLVVGLDGTGDRPAGGESGGQTVQSVANLLRRFDVDVPNEVLRTRNVAAVLVTAEVSPYLRAGGRFEVHVSSLGDARSVRGGVLWMTPLMTDVGGEPVATAQGSLLVSDGGTARGSYTIETTARIPSGGLLEGNSAPRPTSPPLPGSFSVSPTWARRCGSLRRSTPRSATERRGGGPGFDRAYSPHGSGGACRGPHGGQRAAHLAAPRLPHRHRWPRRDGRRRR